MKRIYSVLVENHSGVLCKVAGLFSRRCFNIDSLAVGETQDRDVSCMTIVSSGDKRTIDVIKVKTFDEGSSISRELLLMKVKYNKSNRRDIIEMCEITDNANIVDFSPHTMMIQMCDTTEKIETFMEMFKGISIVEVARTGTLALQKCKETD